MVGDSVSFGLRADGGANDVACVEGVEEGAEANMAGDAGD